MASLVGTVLLALCSSYASGAVHVRGYTRKDGTYVAPYDRSAPRTGGSGLQSSGVGSGGPAVAPVITPRYSAVPVPTVSPEIEPGRPPVPETDGEKAAKARRVFEFYKNGADRGLGPFQYEVGLRYMSGNGTEKNLDMAKVYFQAAKTNGVTQVEAKLQELEKLGKAEKSEEGSLKLEKEIKTEKLEKEPPR